MKIKPISKKQNIVVQDLEKELLVYDLQSNKAFCLNETSAMVFQLCDGKRTILEITDALSIKLKTLVSEDYVRLTLHELNRDGLLENSEEFKTYLTGINRRELVKKIGFASLIALPIVSSVVAPSAAMAASAALPFLAACSTNSQCASGTCSRCVLERDSTCPSFSFCCVNNSSFGVGPGGQLDGCLFNPGSCTTSLASQCCSNQAVTSPSNCGIAGTVRCSCV